MIGPAASVLALAAVVVASPSPAAPVVLGRITDSRVPESSGLARSTRVPGVLWTHNDSGHPPELFSLAPGGRVLAEVRLTGVPPGDAEALANGPGGTLWLGDVGDNRERRSTVSVYRLPEPDPRRDATATPTRFRLRYPDGAHDAEALLVDPLGRRLLVATKELLGGGLYEATLPLDASTVTALRRIGTVGSLVTDGAYAPDGRTYVLRDYASARRYDASGLLLDRIALPAQRQGESVVFTADGSALVVGSEGLGEPLWRVPLPTTPPGASSTRPAASAAPGPTAEARQSASAVGRQVLAALVLSAVLLAVVGVVRRRRARRLLAISSARPRRSRRRP